MNSGVISNKDEDYIVQFLIDSGYDDLDVIPITCILSGSRAYGLHNENSDRDYIAIHIMGSWNCLEHPKYRPNLQVIRRTFDKDLNRIAPGTSEAKVSLDSYELWKVVDLLHKGGFHIYELLYLPTVHHDPSSDNFISLLRKGLTTKIGLAAIGNCRVQQRKFTFNRKKTIMSYYRLIQAIYFLKENEFQWDVKYLWDYMGNITPAGKATLQLYKDHKQRELPLTEGELYFIQKEYEYLIRETNNAMVASRLPDKVPQDTLKQILNTIKQTRGKLL